MPIYEYKCSACQHEMEAIQKFADAPLVTCPACGKDKLTKLVSAAGFHLKGSGWYQTDFKGSGAKPAPKTDEAKAQSAKPEAGKDAAPADTAKADVPKTSAPITPAPASSGTPSPGA